MIWPSFLTMQERARLDKVIEFARSVKRSEREPKEAAGHLSVSTRDLVRALGYIDRNTVGVLADIIIEEVKKL